MKRMIGIIAAIALLVAAMVTPIDLSGIVVGPFLMLAFGAGASWWAAFHVAEHTSDREMYAGILAGIAAGAGAVAGVLLMFAASASIVALVPRLNMALAQFVSHGGVLIGMLLALTDFIFAVSGGFLGLVVYERKHPMWHMHR